MEIKNYPKIFALCLLLLLFLYLFPILWMFLSAIRPVPDTLSIPPSFIFEPTLDHISEVLSSGFLKAFFNSILVGIISTILVLIIAVPGSYALANLSLPKKEDIAIYIISTRMTPPIVILFAFYIVFSQLNLLDTFFSLILLHIAINLPLAIWLLRGFFEAVPKEVEESAKVDGCSTFSAFWRISIPMIFPGIIITGTLSFLFSWMEFLFATTVTGTSTMTVPVLLYRWMSFARIDWGAVTAGGMIYSLPLLIFVFLAREHLTKGLKLGTIK